MKQADGARFDPVTALAEALFQGASAQIDLYDADAASRPADFAAIRSRLAAAGGEAIVIGEADGFHAAIAIVNEQGAPAGLLSLRASEPRGFDAADAARLRDLAACASAIIRADRAEARLEEIEEDHRWAARLSPLSPWRADALGGLIDVGPNILDQMGRPAEALRGWGWMDAVAPEERDRVRAAWMHALGTGERLDSEYQLTMADGQSRWVRARAAPRRDGDGRILRWYGWIEDIHDLKVAQRASEEGNRRLTAVLESTTDHVAFFDRDWRVTYVNHVMARVPVFAAARGRVLWEALPYLRGTLYEERVRTVAAERQPVQFEWNSERAGGWLEINAYPTPEGVAVFVKDINQRYLLEEERGRNQQRSAYQARHNAVTGLPNRLFLCERIDRLKQDGAGLVFLHVGLDNYRSLHALTGPEMAAALLGAFRDRIEQALGRYELIAHLADEDFGILYDAEDADPSAIARAILAAVEEPLELQGTSFVASVSIGVALSPEDAEDAEDLLRKAAMALDDARSRATDGWRRFEPAMQHRLEERQRLRLDLRRASMRGELSIHYQPVVALPGGEISGFEALLRWHHPDHGAVPPDTFVPIAEETGLIDGIGAWALRCACDEAARWPDRMRVAVNLSPVQFQMPHLVDLVTDTLRNSGLAADRLKLEITESVLLQDSEANLTILHALRKAGVLIVLDDFGTGYASLAYLRAFPFHKLKIDRSFITNIEARATSQAIVRSVLGLARALDIGTTAEGVETVGELRWLVAEGCDQAQGYLTGRPMAAQQIAPFLARHRDGSGHSVGF